MNVGYELEEAQLRDHFMQFGTVLDVYLPRYAHGRNKARPDFGPGAENRCTSVGRQKGPDSSLCTCLCLLRWVRNRRNGVFSNAMFSEVFWPRAASGNTTGA